MLSPALAYRFLVGVQRLAILASNWHGPRASRSVYLVDGDVKSLYVSFVCKQLDLLRLSFEPVVFDTTYFALQVALCFTQVRLAFIRVWVIQRVLECLLFAQ